MLREYQLTNFKAFAGPETIPIRPITLIYGPNSSGKSSILQSLLLLKQTLEEANSSTPLLPKGKLVDLGDYREFIHHHDVSKEFSFRAFFTLSEIKDVEPEWLGELLKATGSALVGLQVHFGYDQGTRTINSPPFEIFIDNVSLPLLVYSFQPSVSDSDSRRAFAEDPVNLRHDFWRTWWTVMKQYIEEVLEGDEVNFVRYSGAEDGAEYEPFESLREDLRSYSFEKAVRDLQAWNGGSLIDYKNWLPDSLSSWPIEVWAALSRKLREESGQAQPSAESESGDSQQKQSIKEPSPFEAEIFFHPSVDERKPFQYGLDVSPLTLHVCSVFRRLVEKMVYLGPLRSYPERYYTFSGNVSDQVGQRGEMLSDVLFQNRELIDRVNAQFERFELGYKLKLSELQDEDSNLTNVFTLRLLNKEDMSASIRDVGFGISQVLPIIVQSVLSRDRTLLIEQPEIHLHPALQAELGDLFIQSALGEQKNTFILETHSEHLLLRIMRRMRDTANGTLPAGLPSVRPEDVSIIYVQRKDSASVVRVLELDQEGQLLDPWPDGFFEEGFRERFA